MKYRPLIVERTTDVSTGEDGAEMEPISAPISAPIIAFTQKVQTSVRRVLVVETLDGNSVEETHVWKVTRDVQRTVGGALY